MFVCGFNNCLKFTYSYHVITLWVHQLSAEVTVAEINTPGTAIHTQLTFFCNIITPIPETSHTLNNTWFYSLYYFITDEIVLKPRGFADITFATRLAGIILQNIQYIVYFSDTNLQYPSSTGITLQISLGKIISTIFYIVRNVMGTDPGGFSFQVTF